MSTEHQETTPRLSWFSRFRAGQKPPAAPAETPTGSEKEILQVQKTDLKFAENGKLHRTGEYDLMMKPLDKEPQLVVRRGQEFSIDLFFDRPYTKGTYEVKLIFALEGVKHKPGKTLFNDATFVTVPIYEEKAEESSPGWYAYIAKIQETQVTIQVTAPAKCAVGKWDVQVEIKQQKGEGSVGYSLPKPLIVIFNPWCEEDETYMASEEDRYEYVLNETGCIFRGDVHRPRPYAWTYSQFDSDILDCALYLLQHHCPLEKVLKPSERGCGVKIVRQLSSVVNADDTDPEGVLVGNWSSNCPGGKNANYWTGSREILQEYFSKKKPVKFGQSWVFAGVLTTICRALGIPCRPVTNYCSAREKGEYSLTLDRYVDKDGNEVEYDGAESEWNFHVWCEVWLKRDDIGEEYSGWQATDATPQKLSGKSYQMGPAPVEACKRGEIKIPYDVDFLFSEVNSDLVTWRWMGEGVPPKLINVTSSTEIGQKMSTKAKNTLRDREDLTENYKFKEGTPEEREAFYKAVKLSECCHGRDYVNELVSEVKFELSLPEATIGQPFKMDLIVKNTNASEQREGKGKFKASSVDHTGKIIATVAEITFAFKVGPNSDERIPFTVEYAKYAKHLTSESLLGIFCDASVDNTDIDYSEKSQFSFSKPELTFKIPKQPLCVDEDFDGTVSIENPLPVPLHKGYFVIDAAGISKKKIMKKLKDAVKAGETGSVNFDLHPYKAGKRTITAKFYSNELNDVDGCIEVEISPSENNIMPS